MYTAGYEFKPQDPLVNSLNDDIILLKTDSGPAHWIATLI